MLAPVVLGEVAFSSILIHAGKEHLVILAQITVPEKDQHRAEGIRRSRTRWAATARTSRSHARQTSGRFSWLSRHRDLPNSERHQTAGYGDVHLT